MRGLAIEGKGSTRNWRDRLRNGTYWNITADWNWWKYVNSGAYYVKEKLRIVNCVIEMAGCTQPQYLASSFFLQLSSTENKTIYQNIWYTNTVVKMPTFDGCQHLLFSSQSRKVKILCLYITAKQWTKWPRVLNTLKHIFKYTENSEVV